VQCQNSRCCHCTNTVHHSTNSWGLVVTYPPRKQEYEVEQVLGVPISQGSLAKMQRYFKVCFGLIYQQWLT